MHNDHQATSGTDDAWFACDDFLVNATQSPDALALTVDNHSYTYAEVLAAATKIAHQIASHEITGASPVVAIYADRSFSSYAGVLAAAMRGCAYVPLSPKSPTDRNGVVLSRSGTSCIVHQPQATVDVQNIIAASGTSVTPLSFDAGSVQASPKELPPRLHNSPHAYYLFTSGSTGTPKGVMFRRSNLKAYLDAVSSMTDYGPTDRVSQNFDMTFDLSVHDIFVTWRAGAHLFVPSAADHEDPVAFIRKHDLTCYFAVPTMARKIFLQGHLTPGSLSGLRLSLFCGEALSIDLARAWAQATTHRVENWYGPTEAQSVTYFPFPKDLDEITGQFEITPIGRAFPGMTMTVVDEKMVEVPQGTLGELLISGPQVSDGYLDDPDKTAAAFVTRAGHDGIFYRTGDKVLLDEKGYIQFIDRLDNQIKIRGYRVELGDIETRLREAANGRNVIVVPIPLKSPVPTALAAAVENYPGDCRQVLKTATAALPDYMRPTRLLTFEKFPTNTAGKVNRGEIGKMVASELGLTPKAPRAAKLQDVKTENVKRRRKLLRIIREINPTLSRDDIVQSDNLMDAGLDSLGFVTFTLELEKQFGMELDQEGVSALSYLPFRKIVRRIARMENPPAAKPKKPAARKPLHERARRAISFLTAFPEIVETADKPLAVFAGSSGFFRGISVPDIEQQASAAGLETIAVNAGIGALNLEGIAQLCEFIRDTLKAADKRMAWGVIELDVMHLSTLPPSGDAAIINDYLAGLIEGLSQDSAASNRAWPIATRGTMPNRGGTNGVEPIEPEWMKKRNNEILDAYVGKVKMNKSALKILVRAAAALAEVSDQLAMVVQPLNHPDISKARRAAKGAKYDGFIADIQKKTGALIISDDSFDLSPEDFLDRNHMNFGEGRARFSTQIVDQIINASNAS